MLLAVRPHVLLAICLIVSLPAIGQEVEPSPFEFNEGDFTAFTFFAENDSIQLGGRNEDRNYTGGFGFQFSGEFVRHAHLDAPLRGLDHVFRVSKKHEQWDRMFHSALLFGTGFTPDNLNTEAVVPDDRPYASLVGVSVRRLSVDDQDFDKAWSSEVAVAMLGLPIARNLQTWLHRKLRDEEAGEVIPFDPLGWHNQISDNGDGGEPTALYRVSYERLLLGNAGPSIRKHVQVSGGLAGSVGYYTNVNAMLNARVGWFTSDFWEFTPGAMNVGNQAVGGARMTPQWEFFLFTGARPRLNFYNALLQGQVLESPHTVDIKRGLVEWDLGVAAYIPRLRLQLSWNALAGRTPEFHGGTPRTHTWGSIMVTYAPRQEQ